METQPNKIGDLGMHEIKDRIFCHNQEIDRAILGHPSCTEEIKKHIRAALVELEKAYQLASISFFGDH